MLDINLVPEQLRKKRKSSSIYVASSSSLPPEATWGLIGGLVVFLILIHVFILWITGTKLVQKKNLDEKWAAMLPEKKTADAFLNEIRSLQNRMSSVEKITKGKRILLAPKLNSISDSLLRGVWLNKISLADGLLTIQGSCFSRSQDEMVDIGNFTSALKENNLFVDHLQQIELGAIQRRKIQLAEVADFTITAKLEK